MENDKEVPIEFPSSGLNVATSYGQQPKGSTPTGVNVRSNESILNRERGGSRSGLSKYPPGLLPSGTNVVQHMNIVVDPQGGALLAGSFITGPTEADPDPRWGGRLIRVGGDGIQLNRNQNRQQTSPLRQSQIFDGGGGVGPDFSVSLPLIPLSGGLLVLATLTSTNNFANQPSSDTGPIHVGSIVNGGGGAYTQIGGGSSFADNAYTRTGFTDYYSLSLWYKYATGSANDQTATIGSPSGPSGVLPSDGVHMMLFEFTGFTGAPVGQTITTNPSNVTPCPVGPLLLSNTANALVFEAIAGQNATSADDTGNFTAPASYTDSGFGPGVSQFGSSAYFYKQLKATTVTPSVAAGKAVGYAGIVTSFNHT